MNIFLIGFMGAGKSTVGRLLAAKLNYKFVDLDFLIEEFLKKKIPEIFEEDGESFFREQEKQMLMKVIANNKQVIATGGGTPCFFDNLAKMNESGVTIYLKFSSDILTQRLVSDTQNQRPLLKNKSEKELFDFISKKIEEREFFYGQSKFIISQNIISPIELTHNILLILNIEIE